MYIVELEGYSGNTRIFDKADTQDSKNKEDAVDYAHKLRRQCDIIGINNTIIVEYRYYDYKEIILEL